MFLHIGGDLVLPFRSIISIHDIRIFSDASNRAYLEQMKKDGKLIQLRDRDKEPKAAVITDDAVYLSAISSLTLKRRAGFIDDTDDKYVKEEPIQ